MMSAWVDREECDSLIELCCICGIDITCRINYRSLGVSVGDESNSLNMHSIIIDTFCCCFVVDTANKAFTTMNSIVAVVLFWAVACVPVFVCVCVGDDCAVVWAFGFGQGGGKLHTRKTCLAFNDCVLFVCWTTNRANTHVFCLFACCLCRYLCLSLCTRRATARPVGRVNAAAAAFFIYAT